MARIHFGTDGVRGVAGKKLTADFALNLGRAATELSDAAAPRVLIIRDTRESGEMLEAALAAGVSAAGGTAWLGGVAPTPAAPPAIGRYDLAAVISASHNPYSDNGIKFFGPDADKLSDAAEEAIEGRCRPVACPSTTIGSVRPVGGLLDDYLDALRARFGALDLSGVRALLDCANGATFAAAPAIFFDLGATVDVLADAPDGRNINAGCGATNPEFLSERMQGGGYDVGFAFDGDGDRLMAADRTRRVRDGDELIALAAVHLRDAGKGAGNGVAMTVMTNFGFHRAMRDAGIQVATTKVGDRYVLDALRDHGRRPPSRDRRRAPGHSGAPALVRASIVELVGVRPTRSTLVRRPALTATDAITPPRTLSSVPRAANQCRAGSCSTKRAPPAGGAPSALVW